MSQDHRWITFNIDGKEIAAVTIKGTFPGEIKATAELLAYERGVDPTKITIGTR